MSNQSESQGLEVCIVRTGIANLASVLAGLRRAGARPRVTEQSADVTSAAAVVLPGVGAFGAGMHTLRENDLVAPLQQRIRDGRPTLAVCLGLQLLLESSEESPGEKGLGVVPGQAIRFTGDVRVPQLGWNRVEPQREGGLLRAGHAYFANSYRLTDAPEGWRCARTEHGTPFVSAFERGPVLACQFHPELSARWGLDLLERWLATVTGASC